MRLSAGKRRLGQEMLGNPLHKACTGRAQDVRSAHTACERRVLPQIAAERCLDGKAWQRPGLAIARQPFLIGQ
ncbi:hypothetical protein [Paracoccus marinaquae]|uniref:Uncharacterized protein n=1 Tax=Paracoccus marinaquae TaxID=2841926 RepID=A0ABS6AH90_9RHOB|nr:hypothetical protein [Paracoccus marinaquae]MBU3029487.1 hypothetical protein [Paracoccus marinaquae]